MFFSSSLSFFIENITGRLYNIQNSKLCFRDMKIMSLRNGGDFGKQLVLRTRCLQNHHHSFVTNFHITETQLTILYILNFLWL